jgi:hypothetical protein
MTSPDLTLPSERYDALARQIASSDSPVGIDAERTHVIILDLLLDIRERLDRLERRLDVLDVARSAPR